MLLDLFGIDGHPRFNLNLRGRVTKPETTANDCVGHQRARLVPSLDRVTPTHVYSPRSAALALTIATIPALIGSAKVGHAATMALNSGSQLLVW
jgi:hypothetical protein